MPGTGYQYGDTDFLEYSERLYNNFARQLRAGTAGTPIAVGEALVKAKLAYLATTPDIRGIHEKALLEATLFGLPMLGVNMSSGRDAVTGTGGAITPVPVATGPAASSGSGSYDLSFVPTLTPHTVDPQERARQLQRHRQRGSADPTAWSPRRANRRCRWRRST